MYFAGSVDAMGRISSMVKPVNRTAFATARSSVTEEPAIHGLPGGQALPSAPSTTSMPLNSSVHWLKPPSLCFGAASKVGRLRRVPSSILNLPSSSGGVWAVSFVVEMAVEKALYRKSC
jgi:hypothetical protein